MRKPSLSRWLKREILMLSGLERFSLRKLAAMAHSSHARLVEPLFFYCFENGQIERLYELAYHHDVLDSWRSTAEALNGKNLTELALSGTASDVIPREYSKHLESFAASYRKSETEAESKRIRLERCRELRLRTGATVTDLSRALGLDAGNVSAFLKNGDLGRITLKDATAMMKYLMTL